jgi:hypothetical protein
MLARVHSEAVLAAYLYHGWTISSVYGDGITAPVAEHALRWDLPEAPRSPSREEVARFVHVSNVEDKFLIEGRGIVIVPGLPRDKAGLLKNEDFIVLHDYRKRFLLTQVRAIELSSPPSPKGWGILLPEDVSSEDVVIGMQVWARDSTERENPKDRFER